MITETSQLGVVRVLVRDDGVLVEAGTPVEVNELGTCTYVRRSIIHIIEDREGHNRAVYDFEINAHWREL